MQNLLLQPIKQFVSLSLFSLKLVEKCCGGKRVIDALFHLPSSVIFRRKHIDQEGKLTVVATITGHNVVPNKQYKVTAQTDDGELITIMYFHFTPAYIRKLLPVGQKFTISGDARRTYDSITFVHPEVITSPNLFHHYIGPEPVYPLTAKLSNKTMRQTIQSLLKILPEVPEWIPAGYDLLPFTEALIQVHNPKSPEDLLPSSSARFRLAVDEQLANQVKLRELREKIAHHPAPKFTSSEGYERYLPFELTADQQKCMEDIKQDLLSGHPMNRLIQGDVGSGKTAIAFLTSLIILEHHAQVVILAPTEILAEQHYKTFSNYAKDAGVVIDFMSAQNRKYRESQIRRLKSGETQIVIGTHALLEENIEFQNLGLVVIDEQHRFGVLQRQTLIEKTHYPNVLTMSATPIPRTMLLGLYGDLDVSTIKTKPANRKPITTSVVGMHKLDELVARLQNFDSQIYWVCPVIEESESLVNVNDRCEYLRKYFAPSEVRVLHGKMKAEEKDEIMTQFRNSEFKILVSTVVIEVGVDVPNANVIVIEHAERFGLAQLHQLRGRVGRGDVAAHCVLLYHEPVSSVGRKRLQIMKDTSDGFVISEEDLQLRGAGDILGKEQSGFAILRFSDFSCNSAVVQFATSIEPTGDASLLCELFARVEHDVVN